MAYEEEGKWDREVERADEPEVAATSSGGVKSLWEADLRQQDLPDAGRPRHLEQFTRQRGGVEAMDGVEDKPSSGDKQSPD